MAAKIAIMFMGLVLVFTASDSKLVKIDCDPGPADVYINGGFAGKTPLYYRFRDVWDVWPKDKPDNYTVSVVYNDSYEKGERFFEDTPERADISYVPDEIIFKLDPKENCFDEESNFEKTDAGGLSPDQGPDPGSDKAGETAGGLQGPG